MAVSTQRQKRDSLSTERCDDNDEYKGSRMWLMIYKSDERHRARYELKNTLVLFVFLNLD